MGGDGDGEPAVVADDGIDSSLGSNGGCGAADDAHEGRFVRSDEQQDEVGDEEDDDDDDEGLCWELRVEYEYDRTGGADRRVAGDDVTEHGDEDDSDAHEKERVEASGGAPRFAELSMRHCKKWKKNLSVYSGSGYPRSVVL